MITAIILAAGMSSRIGVHKQLLDYLGHPVIRHVAETITSSNVAETIVVVGAAKQEVCKALVGLPVRIIENEDYALGQSTSVMKGVNAVVGGLPPTGLLFALGDQPLVKVETVNYLIQKFECLRGIVVPYYNQERGNPVIFDQKFIPDLLSVSDDTGGKQLMNRYETEVHRVDVQDKGVTFDIDTWNDYEQLLLHK